MKDPDSISTIHLKLPFKDHMNIKVEAMRAGKSMNQFIVDLLGDKLDSPPVDKLRPGASVTTIIPQPTSVKQPVFTPYAGNLVPKCKVHGTPLDIQGRCLQKGCKYA